MIRAAILCAYLACAASVCNAAPVALGLHLASLHADDGRAAPGSYGWNNANVGVYARWGGGFTLGAYRNSLFRTSAYAGWTFADRADRFALTLGLVTGYDRVTNGAGDYQAVRCADSCRVVNLRREVLPMVAPSVRIPLTDSVSARLVLLAGPRQPAALHLALEWRL